LRLSTPDWHIQHIGNVLPKDRSEAGIQAYLEAAPVQKERSRSFWEIKFVNRILRWLYNRIFDVLFKS
jgi:hypothetical protein